MPDATAMPDATIPVLRQLNLALDGAANLPPELRDSLLLYLQQWAEPAEQIEVAQALRSTHGQLPTLLDYEAHARLAANEPVVALELIERRQRRNTTIASQGLEARALLACGHAEGARRTAIDLARSYPRHAGALAAATSVLAAADDFAAVEEAVAAYLDAKPNDMQGILSMAAAAATTGRAEIADTYLQRLGAGVPAGITDEHGLIYLATGLRAVDDDRQGIEEAHMTVEHLDLGDLDAAIADGRLTDAKTLIGLLRARDRLR